MEIAKPNKLCKKKIIMAEVCEYMRHPGVLFFHETGGQGTSASLKDAGYKPGDRVAFVPFGPEPATWEFSPQAGMISKNGECRKTIELNSPKRKEGR